MLAHHTRRTFRFLLQKWIFITEVAFFYFNILSFTFSANKSNVQTQLNLALAWNRCDMARREIFTSENRAAWQVNHFNICLMSQNFPFSLTGMLAQVSKIKVDFLSTCTASQKMQNCSAFLPRYFDTSLTTLLYKRSMEVQ